MPRSSPDAQEDDPVDGLLHRKVQLPLAQGRGCASAKFRASRSRPDARSPPETPRPPTTVPFLIFLASTNLSKAPFRTRGFRQGSRPAPPSAPGIPGKQKDSYPGVGGLVAFHRLSPGSHRRAVPRNSTRGSRAAWRSSRSAAVARPPPASSRRLTAGFLASRKNLRAPPMRKQ